MILTKHNADATRERLLRVAKSMGVEGSSVGMLGRSFTSITAKEEGGGYELEGVATTETVDSDKEVVLSDGLNWEPLKAFKVLYGDHMYGNRNAVATLRWITKSANPNGWRLRARLLPDAYSDEIVRVRMLAARNAVGMSIGFMVREAGSPTDTERRVFAGATSVVRKADVFEVSFTAMPCNLSCVGTEIYADDSKSAILDELVTKGLIGREYAFRQVEQRRVLCLDD